MVQTGKQRGSFLSLFYFLGLVVFTVAFSITLYFKNTESKVPNIIRGVERQLKSVSSALEATDSTVVHLIQNKQNLDWRNLDRYFGGLHQSVVIEYGDSLIYWNNSDWPVNSKKLSPNSSPQIISSAEGWYMRLNQYFGPYHILIFSKLQSNYLIHNSLLSNFGNGTILPSFRVKFVEGGRKGVSAYYLKSYHVGLLINKGYENPDTILLLYAFFVLAYVFLYLFIDSISEVLKYRYFPKRSWSLHLSAFIGIVILRFLDSYIDFPLALKHSFLFTEVVTTIPGFTTLGELLLNLTLLLVFIWKFRNLISEKPFSKFTFPKLKAFIILLIVFFLTFLLYALTDGILISYGKQFLLNNSFFSSYGLADLIFFTFLSLLIFLLADSASRLVKALGVRFKWVVIFIVILGLLFAVIFHPELDLFILSVIVPLMLIAVSFYLSFNKNPYVYALIALLVLSISGSILFNHTKQEVRNAHQELTASLLSQHNDPYFEFLFRSMSGEILRDPKLKALLKSNSGTDEYKVSKYLKKQYFNRYFNKYSKQFTLCKPGQELQIQPGNQIVGCDEYFANLPGKTVIQSKNFNLSLIRNNQESIYYLATFHFVNPTVSSGSLNLYVEFFADFIPKGVGYPELLVNSHQNMLHLSGYSFARYYNGTLQYKFGDFLYPIDFTYFKGQPLNQFFYRENFKQIIVSMGPKGYLVLSRPKESISMWLLPFSALFLFSSFIVILFITLKFGKQVVKLFRYSFRARLQLIFFSSVLSIFIVLSFISLYYFNENSRNRMSDYLKEKTHSVLIEIQHKMANYPTINHSDQIEIQDYLQKFSLVFFSDINLYDRSGWLIASSRPEIFDRGLQSRLINPKAFEHIRIKNQLFFLSKEHIRRMDFYSSYVPLTLMNGKEVGIINLPYFARQSEIQHSYYQMLANLLSLFVITGILGLIIILYLSKILTKPLRMLQDKINLVSIEKQNEKIVWEDQDEIGQLIEAYNKMVEKLEQSTELMKFSERERAWSEMARQITHEIRNPLTPMKLNVQYLLKAYQQKDKSFDDKLKNISQSLISQIDSLNEVAGMFSDFSKSSLPKNEKANLLSALKESIALFKKSYAVSFSLNAPDEDNLWVWASSKSLMRIFNNLAQNAVQAMENNSDKRIEVEITTEVNYLVVRFTDFGKGISEEDKSRIFQPYFTTKSTGTGLGLAIVRNMMKEMEGAVYFESERGKGTSFYLKFRKV